MLLSSLRRTGDALPRALTVVYPIRVVGFKWLCCLVRCAAYWNASAFAFNAASVCSELFADHAAVHAAPAAVALKVRIRFTGAVVVVVALLCMSFAVVDQRTVITVLLSYAVGSFMLPTVSTEGRTTPQWQAPVR
jgi:hypothetical protein